MRSARPSSTPSRRHRRVLAVLAGAGAVLAIAACGSSSSNPTGATNPTGASSPIGLSKCMRAHGLSNFPDPTAGPGGEGFNGIGLSPDGSLTVDGISFSGPALRSAEKACKQYLPGGGGPPPPLSASQKRGAIANAECMRKHGVPNFPDPIFPAGGGVEVHLGPGTDPGSPAFKQAAAACGRHF
jgi:hypothetical protein